MEWSEQIHRYCERGLDAGFWAEPANAMTNAAFVVVGIVALMRAVDDARHPVCGRLVAIGLASVTIAIGIGSFLFHTLATRWAQLADTLPIGLFMIAYLAVALRCFLALPWIAVGGGVAVFIAALRAAGDVDCSVLATSVDAADPGACLNGTPGYAPALLALFIVAAWLWRRRHRAASTLFTAGVVLLVSMALRTLDIASCDATRIAGYAIGTHFLWHLLNAGVLHILLAALTPAQETLRPPSAAQ
jgi:hypothetical protein